MDRRVQSWRLFEPTNVLAHVGVTALLWLGLLGYLVLAARQPGGLHEALTSTDGRGRNGIVYLAVMAGGYTLVLLVMTLGRYSVVQVDDTGLQLRWAGRVRRRVQWTNATRCRPLFDQRGQLVALDFSEHSGRHHSFSLGLFAPGRALGQEILAAVGEHVPLAEAKVAPMLPARESRAGWLAIWILLAIIMLAGLYTAISFVLLR